MTLSPEILQTFAPLVALLAIFYFLVFRPQQQRVKQHKTMIDAVRRGDIVVTAGGLIGKITKVKDDGEVLVEIADNVLVRVVKSTLSDVRAKSTEKSES